MVQGHDSGDIGITAQLGIQPGQLHGTQLPAVAAGDAGVTAQQPQPRIVHPVVATAVLRSRPHEARLGEDLEHHPRVVVVARNDVHRDVQAGEQLASRLILSGFAVIGEVTGDEHAVRPGLQGLDAGECLGAASVWLVGMRPGCDVGIRQMSQQHPYLRKPSAQARATASRGAPFPHRQSHCQPRRQRCRLRRVPEAQVVPIAHAIVPPNHSQNPRPDAGTLTARRRARRPPSGPPGINCAGCRTSKSGPSRVS